MMCRYLLRMVLKCISHLKDKGGSESVAIIFGNQFYLLCICCDEKSGIMVGYDLMDKDEKITRK